MDPAPETASFGEFGLKAINDAVRLEVERLG
jgi:hypothetical protein